VTTKVCNKCGVEKDAGEFWNDIRRRDGLQCWCISCMNEHKYTTHPERQRRKQHGHSDNPETKVCSNCNIEKPLSDFHFHKSREKGVDYFCKVCRNEYNRGYYAEHLEENHLRAKIYCANNSDVIKEKNKQKYIENKEEINARNKKYAQTEAGKERNYNAAHLQEHAEHQREYRKTPLGKIHDSQHRHRRRSAQQKTICTLTLKQWGKILTLQNNKCAECGREFTSELKPTKDHIIPLSLGGGLTFGNVQALCRSCNSIKHDRVHFTRAITELLVVPQ
jgi:hypothetical protein